MAQGILDYFMVSPGDKKRAELELQNRLKLAQGTADIEKRSAMDLRDSNQLNADFQKHKQERELQDALSQMYPENNPSLSPDENSTLALIHAGDRMNEIKAAQPLAQAATGMEIAEQKAGSRPYNKDIGATSALSNIEGNRAGALLGKVNQAINLVRQETAPKAAAMQDNAAVEEAINNYEQARSNARTIPAREQATISSAFDAARKGEYNQSLYNGLNSRAAAGVENAKNLAGAEAYKFLLDKPQFNPIVNPPNNIGGALALQMLMQQLGQTNNPTSAFSGGGLTAPVGPKPLGLTIPK